jgi:ketosteroid isomerase-like protein
MSSTAVLARAERRAKKCDETSSTYVLKFVGLTAYREVTNTTRGLSMGSISVTEQDRNAEFVRGVYKALFAGDFATFKDATSDDFRADVMPAVPWGGVHHGAEAIRTDVLPALAAVIDFPTMRLISVSGDGDHVAALLTARSVGGDEIWLAEHWTLSGGKLSHLRAFYFDARPLVSPPTATAR